MYDLLSAKEIRKKFREGLGRDVSLQAIHYMADKLGWKQRHIGGKIGYHRTFYTALAQHLTELLACDTKIKAKLPFDDLKKTQKPKKSVKKPKEITWNDGNYFTYNGERDNADYEWEKNEDLIRRAIMESVNELDLYHSSNADHSIALKEGLDVNYNPKTKVTKRYNHIY